MPKTMINQFPSFTKQPADDGSSVLKISEMFGDTIQGEGMSVGIPATFIRLQNCTLSCVWCDTLAVWKAGNAYSVNEVLDILEQNDMIEKYRKGQHIIFTGGSPLLQQDSLLDFCRRFESRFGFNPIYEVENEVTREINLLFANFISIWNNSPKLSNSGMKRSIRYKPQLLQQALELSGCGFKFVVDCEEDWQEILDDFIIGANVPKNKIFLMPCGETQEQLSKNREMVADMCVKHGLRFSDRLHITIWDKKTGV